MKYDPNKHHRRSIRLPGYDYSQSGAYFVTICAYQRQYMFGDVVSGQMRLNQYGGIVADEWMIMPNHFHAIMVITDTPRMDTDTPRRGGSRDAKRVL